MYRDVILWRPYTMAYRRYQWNHGVPIPLRYAVADGNVVFFPRPAINGGAWALDVVKLKSTNDD